MDIPILQKIIIWAVPVIFAITVHEVAHGWVASKLGDPTAKMLGRVTLNPSKHIDPIGTIILPLLLLYFSSFIFGWAKPVPVNWNNLKNPKRDMALVALAGPLANLIMAILWGLFASAMINIFNSFGIISQTLALMGQAGLIINVIIMIVNLIPIPPLDGSRILASVSSRQVVRYLDQIEPYGFFIIIALLATGIFAKILWPLVRNTISLLYLLVGLPGA